MAALWTNLDDQILAKLYMQGLPLEEIADRFDRTVNAVSARAGKLGLRDRRPRSSRYREYLPTQDEIRAAKSRVALRRLREMMENG